jgi:hypothetical protein
MDSVHRSPTCIKAAESNHNKKALLRFSDEKFQRAKVEPGGESSNQLKEDIILLSSLADT